MITRRILFLLAIAFGAFFVVYGGMDDSPGGQMLGLVAIGIGIFGLVKNRKA